MSKKMNFKIGDKVKSFFGNGIIKEIKETENMNFYKIVLNSGENKGKMPWFAEHELDKITYEEIEEEIIDPGFEGEEEYKGSKNIKDIIIFADKEHKDFYFSKKQQCKDDTYTNSLIYTLGICETTRCRFDKIYDIKKRQINPEQINQGWQTGTSYKVTRLAFNLFTDGVPTAYGYTDEITEENFKECREYSVSDIFCCELAPFFVQAIKIRYPAYFSN